MIKIIIKITGLFINFTKPDRKLYILEQRFTIVPQNIRRNDTRNNTNLCVILLIRGRFFYPVDCFLLLFLNYCLLPLVEPINKNTYILGRITTY